MNKIFIYIVSMIFLSIVAIAASTPATAADKTSEHLLDPAKQKSLLKKLEKVQRQVRTFQAEFLELRKMEEINKALRFEGKLYYQNEGDKELFLMHYRNPVKSILRVKEGKALFYVEGSPTADLVDLSGMGKVAAHSRMFVWDPENFTGKIWECSSGYRFEGYRNNQATNSEATFSIFLDRESLLARKIRIKDKSGDVTEIMLTGEKINKPLPSWVTDFTLPEGVEVNKLNTP